MNIEEILSRLKGVTRHSWGWSARCPAHDDKHASLSIGVDSKTGKTLLYCHVKCEVGAICSGIDIQVSDLFPDNGGNGCPPKTTATDRGVRKEIVATYDYTDEFGVLLFQVVRYLPKDFRQRAPDGNGGWNWSTKGIRKVLFGLPELIEKAQNPEFWPVLVLEGEKSVLAARELGFVATCSSGGAGKWLKTDPDAVQALFESDVVVIPDNDEPGRKHAEIVRGSLADFTKVRVVELDVPSGGDIVDWIAGGGTQEALLELINKEPPTEAKGAVTKKGLTPRFSDMDNAMTLVSMFGEDIRYVVARKKFFVWDGSFWREDKGEVAMLQKARLVAEAALSEALANPDEDEAKRLEKKAQRLFGLEGLNKMVSLARSEPGITVEMSVFDGDPYVLGVGNGWIDLTTGRHEHAERGRMITKSCGVKEYNENEKCPRWRRFLKEVTCGEAELEEYLQRVVGYWLSGVTSERQIWFFWGGGANGKTVFVETIHQLLGGNSERTYSVASNADILLRKSSVGVTNDIARLSGARLVHTVETKRGAKVDEAQLKLLTGNDTITARFLYEENFNFNPTHKIVVSTNEKPRIEDSSKNSPVWARLRLVPFLRQFTEEEQDKSLAKKLEAELPGILNWAIEGSLMWQSEGLLPPQIVSQATEEYRNEEDLFGQFLDEKIHDIPGFRLKAADAYNAFKHFAETAGIDCGSQTWFGREMGKNGHQSQKIGGTRYYENIGLVTEEHHQEHWSTS